MKKKMEVHLRVSHKVIEDSRVPENHIKGHWYEPPPIALVDIYFLDSHRFLPFGWLLKSGKQIA